MASDASVEFAAEGSTGPELLRFADLQGESFLWSEGALMDVFSVPCFSEGGVSKVSMSGEDFLSVGELGMVPESSAEPPTEVSLRCPGSCERCCGGGGGAFFPPR